MNEVSEPFSRSFHVNLRDIFPIRHARHVHVEATVWVYWGDDSCSYAWFPVSCSFNLDVDGNVQMPSDWEAHEEFNQCLRNGLGVLGLAFKPAILEWLLDIARGEVD